MGKTASSFASDMDSNLCLVTSSARVLRRGQAKKAELESIAVKTEYLLGQICVEEITETLGNYDKSIEHQYEAFKNMVEQVKKAPNDALKHMTHFREIYEREKSDLSLDVYYWSVMGSGCLFSRPLLKVYLDQSAGSRELMKQRCFQLAYLLHIGLTAHMAYIYVTEDNEAEFRKKWALRMTDIQNHVQNALNECKD